MTGSGARAPAGLLGDGGRGRSMAGENEIWPKQPFEEVQSGNTSFLLPVGQEMDGKPKPPRKKEAEPLREKGKHLIFLLTRGRLIWLGPRVCYRIIAKVRGVLQTDQSPRLRRRSDGEPIHPEAPGQRRRRRIRGGGGEEGEEEEGAGE